MEPIPTRFAVRALAIAAVSFAFTTPFWLTFLGAWGTGALGLALVLALGAVLFHTRPRWSWRFSPKMLFLAAAVGVTWLATSVPNPGTSIATVLLVTPAGVVLGLCLNGQELLQTLAASARWILGASACVWIVTGSIEHRDLLGLVAVIGGTAFAIQLAPGHAQPISRPYRRGRHYRPAWATFWLLVAATVVGISGSLAVWLSACGVVAVAAVALAFRRIPIQHRPIGYGVLALLALTTVVTMASLGLLPPPGQTLTPITVIAIITLVGLVLSTGWRSWFLAIDRPPLSRWSYQANTLLPLLSMVALAIWTLCDTSTGSGAGAALLLAALSMATKRASNVAYQDITVQAHDTHVSARSTHAGPSSPAAAG